VGHQSRRTRAVRRPFSPPLPFFLPVATLALRSGASGRGSASWRRGAASYRLPPKLADGGAAGAPGEGDGDEGEEDVRCVRWPLSSCSPIPLAPSGARPSASSPFSRADADGRRTEWPAGAAPRGLLQHRPRGGRARGRQWRPGAGPARRDNFFLARVGTLPEQGARDVVAREETKAEHVVLRLAAASSSKHEAFPVMAASWIRRRGMVEASRYLNLISRRPPPLPRHPLPSRGDPAASRCGDASS
jgi:hypothetical protein